MDSAVLSPLTARRGGPLQGRTRVPGDKSISHRALILGALTVGESTVAGLLEGEDVLHTAEAMRALGAQLVRGADGLWRIHGVGVAGFAQPAGPLDFGNSGTGCRLAIGAVAGNSVTATFIGDASLSGRPMRRVLDPLERMGARVIEAAEGGRLPLTLQGAADPVPIVYESPVPSAQLKSAVLLAGLAAPGETTVIEAEATRDHTERLLKHFGAKLTSKPLWRARPPHHLAGPARARAGQCRCAGRSVLGGVPDGRGFAGARLRSHSRCGDDQSAAHRTADDAARNGRQYRGGGDARRRRRGSRRSARASRRNSKASTCRPNARRR